MPRIRSIGLWVPLNHRKTLPVEVARHAFAYVFEGSGTFRDASGPRPVKVDDTGDVDNAVYNDAPAVRHPRCAMRGRRLGIRARQLRSIFFG